MATPHDLRCGTNGSVIGRPQLYRPAAVPKTIPTTDHNGQLGWHLSVLARLMLTNFRSFDVLGGWWEINAHALLQENGLPLVRNGMMHHRAVLVSLDVLFKALSWAAPGNGANLLAWYLPVGEAFKAIEARLSVRDSAEVDESISQSSL